jgi:hypothetical protein
MKSCTNPFSKRNMAQYDRRGARGLRVRLCKTPLSSRTKNGITLVSSSVRLTIMGRVQTIPDLHINVTAAIAR